MSLTKQFSPDGSGEDIPRERDEWSLEATLNDFRHDYGDDALTEKIDQYMTERGLY